MTVSSVDMTRLSCQADPERPWFYFDVDYYVRQCVESGISAPLGSDEMLCRHYVERGAASGQSPNRLFEERYYRNLHPAVARDIRAGEHASGFEHFVAVGAEIGLSPTWFFDGDYYSGCNPDLTAHDLRAGGFRDRYAHYLLIGIRERRPAHWTIVAQARLAPERTWPADLSELQALLADAERLSASLRPAFDYGWMREKYGWSYTVRPTTFMSHYVLHVRSQVLSPSPFFDELYYLSCAPEIQTSVDKGLFASGYQHFVLHGMAEGRRPFPGFDPRFYLDANMCQEANEETATPFVHFLRHHTTRRLALAPPLAALPIAEDAGKGLYERRCMLNAARLGQLRLPSTDVIPDVSVIIVTRNSFEQTANCILLAAGATIACLEIIVFDNASSDEVGRISVINPAIRSIRSEVNIGFTLAVNRAAEIARGRMILLLNNDVELTACGIDLALARLDAEPDVGAVGGRIVRMHGRLQEAGSLVWRDGTCHGYGRDHDPLDGQYNVALDVDFCSGCFLAIRRQTWQALGGFDEAFAPAYYEDTDLCLRLWQRDQRVVYDPRIVVWHFEYGSSRVPEESLTLMRRNQRLFATRHRRFLADCLPPTSTNLERARLRHVRGPRLLFIEDMLPKPVRGMGFVRSAAILRTLTQCCGLVSVLGLHDNAWPIRLPEDENGRQVEILSHINVTNLDAFLRERVGVYDIVWLSRTHNLARLAGWRAACPEFFTGLRVVLDTEAVAAARRVAYARQAGQSADLAELIGEELEQLDGVDHICTVNTLDHSYVLQLLEKRGLCIPVSLLGHALAMQSELPAFEATTDIVIVGSWVYPDGPNGDALLWFDRDIRPLLAELPALRFVVAGAEAARFCRSAGLRHDYQVIDNPSDMAEVFRTARVMVAPTRFAAGIPMKVHDAASHGVPVVMTELLADQLGWRREGVHWTAATAHAMAAAIAYLATNRVAWRNCQALQAALVEHDCDSTRFEATIRGIIANLSAASDNVIHVTPARRRERRRRAG